jgi:peroxiredoxin
MKRTRALLRTVAPVAFLIAAAPCLAAEAGAPPAVGAEAPAFSLPDTQGVMHALADYKTSKATVVIFVSTQCPVSNAYNERMASITKEYSSKGVSVLGVYSNKAEGIDEIAAHAKEHGFTFVTLKDANNVVADKYGASVTPEAFVIDAKGMLRYHGRIDDNQKESSVTSKDLRSALDQVVGGQDVAKTEAKAFGCSIKRINKAGA